MKEEQLAKEEKEEVTFIKLKISKGESFGMDSLRKKMIYENKLDKKMMESLKAKVAK